MMKSQTRIPLFGVLMVCAVSTLTFTDAARERMTVEEDGITFKVDLFDDGRSNPYKVAFTQDGTQSSFRLSGAGKVVKINVGSDKYKVLPGHPVPSVVAKNKCLLSIGAKHLFAACILTYLSAIVVEQVGCGPNTSHRPSFVGFTD